ncbi:MAG TPA: PASTA domain-containing protein [Solirubrobacteraceae bacterium]|nr:PASTA domain-containing protein [Solirubrobacteraceae bacterium]
MVTVVVTGLETDTHYQYTVEASSLAGATSFSSWFESIPLGAAPHGSKDEEVYIPPELPWVNQSGNEAAERTVREQREKEHAEEKAKEAASHATEEAEALKRREEEAVHQVVVHPKANPACVVPNLKGYTLAVARHALTAAHCLLGIVHRPVRQHGTLHVKRQSARAGERLADDALVALWIEARSDAR